MIGDFYRWLATFSPSAQLAIIMIVLAGASVFLLVFRRGRDEPRWVRWVVACTAGFIASMMVSAVIAIARLVWDT